MTMYCSARYFAAAFLTLNAAVNAASFSFATDPFAGSDAPTTPGRQVVGGEPFITFSVTTDVFKFDTNVFGVEDLVFANDVVSNLPTSSVNVIVLQTTDNDNDPTTPFAAGIAANLIADQITTSAPGFFIYFNSGLNLPRLVFSADLSDNSADLKILARMTNFAGQPEVLPTFSASNFAPTPEPSSILMMTTAGAFWAGAYMLRRRKRSRG